MVCTLDSAKVSYEGIISGLLKLMGPIAAQVSFFSSLAKLLDLRSAITREARLAVQTIVQTIGNDFEPMANRLV